LCDREEVGMAEIAAVVAKDASVAARLVATANSPFYSPKRGLQDIDQCLAVMGTSIVRRLALNQSVAELFGRFQKGNNFDLRYFWYHSLFVAVMARRLATQQGYSNGDEAYLAGLLHDVGQLALLTLDPERYLPLLRDFDGDLALIRQEQALFEINHAEVGAWMAQRWNLHSLFADSIRYHHESLDRIRDAHLLAQIVALANLLGTLPETELETHAAALAYWRLEPAQVVEMQLAAEAETRRIGSELGLDLPAKVEPMRRPEAEAEADSAVSELADAVSQRMQGMLAQPEWGEKEGFEAAKRDVLRGASQIFSAPGCALFMPKDDVLHWQPLADEPVQGNVIRIACSSADSRIAAAYHGRICLAGVPSRPDNLADAQLLRLLAGERLLCLPLMFAGKPLGVLAVALDLVTVEYFGPRQALIITFAREAGKCLAAAIRQDERIGAVLRDASQRQVQHARKLIHEAGNPLGIVRNYISVLRMQVEQMGQTKEASKGESKGVSNGELKDQVKEEFSLIENELRRVSGILQQFNIPAFDTASILNLDDAPVPIDINALVSEVIQFCRLGKAELRDIEVRLNLAPNLPRLARSGDILKQILTNLLFNAAEALAASRTLTIDNEHQSKRASLLPDSPPHSHATGQEFREKGRISLTSALWTAGKKQQYIELSVSDNGPGLPQDVLANLYQPVKTQKGGQHAGLGLSIVSALVEELDGMLQCSSSESGTQFKILLPLHLEKA
jgi:putative nucleotidyltransferase with HDIG domain